MIKLEKFQVMNMDNAIRGARNPMNSWGKSDSFWTRDKEMCRGCNEASCNNCPAFTFVLGNEDLKLAKKLCNAGPDHRKFIRQILVTVDITAPLYWWKEYDTYKVGTTANSTSTMHKIHSKEFTREDFSCDRMSDSTLAVLDIVISELEILRNRFNETKDKQHWDDMIQLLPSSFNQTRTCTFTYENLFSMIPARKSHKLVEWREFCDWALHNLPYMTQLLGKGEARDENQ